jgi:hypothetical protein
MISQQQTPVPKGVADRDGSHGPRESMNSDLKTAQSLAHAVSDLVSVKLTPRPYNRFAPEETIWWLVPSSVWPAYKFGKLFFEPRTDRLPTGSPESIYFGFYVEKGLSPVAGNIYPRTWIMDDEWFWDDFLKQLESGVPDSSPVERIITISAGPARPPERHHEHSDEIMPLQEEGFKASRLFFKVHGISEVELMQKDLNPAHGDITEYLASTVATADSIARLASILRDLPSSFDWVWIDFQAGTLLRSSDQITTADLWALYLKPWQECLRCAG